MNPIAYVFDPEAQALGELVVRFKLPYADILDLPAEELGRLVDGGQTVEFTHTLEQQTGGQLKAGFLPTLLFEDTDSEKREAVRSRYFPPLLATRAVKPGAALPAVR
jgi:hypothetical protein